MKPTELLTKTVELSPRRAGSYRVGLAATSDEILAAQRLRDDVFTHQTGARTPGPTGIDADEFDKHCDHLIVWHRPLHQPPDEPPERVVATYRLLPPHRNHSVPRARGLYSAQEFDLTRPERTVRTTVERTIAGFLQHRVLHTRHPPAHSDSERPQFSATMLALGWSELRPAGRHVR